MVYFMGIDGGGSSLRCVIVTPDFTLLAQSEGATANPGVVGREAAAAAIQTAMREALAQAALSAADLRGIGIGVAGAARYPEWLVQVVSQVAPDSLIAPSSDVEIALIGARGERHGVLLLAGTGSAAYGINQAGEALQVGGWGYLIGDEGSGYWLGRKALQAIVRAADGRGQSTLLTKAAIAALGLQTPLELLLWLYQTAAPRTRDIAGLAPLVLRAAADGDRVASGLIDQAADELALSGRTVMQRLGMNQAEVAFAGGLIDKPNNLSQRLCALLHLPALPQPRYPPVIGAALLARLRAEA